MRVEPRHSSTNESGEHCLGAVDDPALPPCQTARLSPTTVDLAAHLLQCLVNKHRSVNTPGANLGLTII